MSVEVFRGNFTTRSANCLPLSAWNSEIWRISDNAPGEGFAGHLVEAKKLNQETLRIVRNISSGLRPSFWMSLAWRLRSGGRLVSSPGGVAFRWKSSWMENFITGR